MTTAIFLIIALLILAGLWIVSVQRKLVSSDELCKNALSQIGVQQSSRWDALSALAELVKSYSEHEYKTISDVIARRAAVGRDSSPTDADAQEELLGTALRSINVVAEQYPQLKANENYIKAMDSVNTYENQVRMSRMVFNDTVTKFNRMTRQFPDSAVASMLGFRAKEYLQENQEKSGMPSMKI